MNVATLEALIESSRPAEDELATLRRQVSGATSDAEKEALEAKIEAEQKRIDQLRGNFRRIAAGVEDGALQIVVTDTGKQLDTNKLRDGHGLRIVKETLALHYRAEATMRFESTNRGGSTTIQLPVSKDRLGHH